VQVRLSVGQLEPSSDESWGKVTNEKWEGQKRASPMRITPAENETVRPIHFGPSQSSRLKGDAKGIISRERPGCGISNSTGVSPCGYGEELARRFVSEYDWEGAHRVGKKKNVALLTGQRKKGVGKCFRVAESEEGTSFGTT